MGDFEQNSPKIVLLLPSEIKTDKEFDVRPFRSGELSSAERRELFNLAASIEKNKQEVPVIITPDRTLVTGHRRRQAVMLINERRDANFAPLLRLECKVVPREGDLRLLAIASNLHRTNHSPMDLAYLICTIRKEKGWEGRQHTRKLAEYLSLDDSVISTHESLMRLETELQTMLHEGVISVHSAMSLRKTIPTPEERAAVMARAKEIQEEEVLDATIDAYKNGRKSLEETSQSLSTPRIRIQHPAVLQAIREKVTANGTAPSMKLHLNRQELIASIAQFDTEDYSPELRKFCRYWSQEYAVGRGTKDTLVQLAGAL